MILLWVCIIAVFRMKTPYRTIIQITSVHASYIETQEYVKPTT
jgi:hypothetical protein